MEERAFEVPAEVPLLIERAAELARAHRRTGPAERRFLEDILVACATAQPGARAVLYDNEDGLDLRVTLHGGGQQPRVIEASGAQRGSAAVDEANLEPQSWIYDFAQQMVRQLLQLRHELEETNHGVMALYSEIDTRRAAEKALHDELETRAQRLLAVDKRKDEFIAMLGHELRNPIATIEGAVQTLRGISAVSRDAEASGVLDVLERHGRNVKRMLDDLLNVSRIKRGKVVLSRRPTELVSLVRACGDDVRRRAEVRGHRLHVELPEGELWLSADAPRLEQVITNLLDNAIKYTPGGGEVRLGLRRVGDEAIVSVQDSGVGIDNERIRAAFDPFVQFDVSKDRAAGGLGLGLSVVKALAELHRGSVRAHSEGRGQGSTFEVRLPVSKADAPQRVEPAPAGEPAQRPDEGVLLLVEDNVDLRELTARRLVRQGFRVIEAGSYDEALRSARAEPPDVLVTDIGLPGRDGFELARALSEQAGQAPRASVALSGYGPPRDESLRTLFDAYMVKPLDIDALLELVHRQRASSPPETR